MEAAFLEVKLKTKVYINLPKGMVDLDLMIQEEYENTCTELTGRMYGCVDADILWFLCF